MLPFLCLHFWSVAFRICVHSFRAMYEHMYSRSARLTVKGFNQSGMDCVGSSLFMSLAGSRFPMVCLSWSVSIGFRHACLSLRVVTGSNNVPNLSRMIRLILSSRCWRQNAAGIWWQSWYNEKHWPVIDFPFGVNCGVSPFIETLAFYRAIALLRTDQNHQQKLVLTRLFARSPVAVSRIWGFVPFQSIHCIQAQISLLNIVH